MYALHVEPGEQREMTAQRLADAAAGWAQTRGCRVLASDTSLENQWEQKLHLEFGFEEVARKVVYRRVLAVPAAVPPVVPTSRPAQPLPVTEVHAERVGESQDHDDGPSWWPGSVRVAIIVLGILSFYFTNVFSGNVFVGVVLPIADVLFAIYLLMLLVSMKYRRKSGAGERQLELYQVSKDSE